MIRIAISAGAFDAIAATLPFGSVAFEPQTKDKGERRERYGTLALQSHTKKIIFGSSVRR